MMIAKSKRYTKIYQELESELKTLIYNFAYDEGLDYFFLEDSKAIQESISRISGRVARLLESTTLLKYQIGSRKKFNEKGAKT